MRTIYTISSIDKDSEAYLWKSAILVFDTCALLDFYYMTKENQKIIADILKTLSARIWLPAQVLFEFKKNQNEARMKPISEKYSDKDLQSNKLIDDLKSYISQWERKYYHPFISDHNLAQVKAFVEEISPKVADIKKLLRKNIKNVRKKLGRLLLMINWVHASIIFQRALPFLFPR